MQGTPSVTAFVASPVAQPRRNIWILNSWRDLILYVGTPLLLVPLFGLAQTRWSAQDIYVFVGAFGAMGHHLPGMIRAYGDRALFERFRWRFVFAPIFLVATCVAFYWWDLKGIILVVFFWGVWHGMMQTYGFCRIYDAKMGSFAALTRRLDFAVCAVWFAAGVLLSSARMSETLHVYYASGGLYLSPGLLRGLQQLVLLAALGVTILFLANFARMWWQGNRPNPVKLGLLTTSIAFWCYCNIYVNNILAGIALFEVFHDVQYLSLVWIYNRNRVEKDNSIGGFMRFVFRRSGSLVGLYVGLVFAYGSLGYLSSQMEIESIKRVLTGAVAASGLLHFYYDGFIWKVRERSTRESLGLTGGTAAAVSNASLPGWFWHGLKWVAVFVIPLAALGAGQIRGAAPEVEREGWVTEAFPSGALQHFNYGAALQTAGRLEEAVQHFRISLRFDPVQPLAHFNLASALLDQAKVEESATEFEGAIRLVPRNPDFHHHYGYALSRLGRHEEAEEQFKEALRLKPRSAPFHYGYAGFLAKMKRPEEAIAQYREALQWNPAHLLSRAELGDLLFAANQIEEAKAQYLAALQLKPNHAALHNSLGTVYFRQGQMSQAALQYQEALRLDPNFKEAEENLRLTHTNETRFNSRPLR